MGRGPAEKVAGLYGVLVPVYTYICGGEGQDSIKKKKKKRKRKSSFFFTYGQYFPASGCSGVYSTVPAYLAAAWTMREGVFFLFLSNFACYQYFRTRERKLTNIKV